jgi:hypothetical protein
MPPSKSVWQKPLAKLLPTATTVGVIVAIILTPQISRSTFFLLALLELVAASGYIFQWMHSDFLEKLRPIQKKKTKKNPDPPKVTSAQIRLYGFYRWFPVGIAIAILGICEMQTYFLFQERRMDGYLAGAGLNAPPNSDYPSVRIGNAYTVFHFTPKAVDTALFKPFPDAEFVVSPGKVMPLISTTVRDRNGNLVVSLDKNHWMITDQALDRNFTDTSLEVLDKSGHVIFQVWMEDSRPFQTVHVQGEWWANDGRGMRAVAGIGGDAEFVPLQTNHQALDDLIKPMFVYPSKEHRGELAK